MLAQTVISILGSATLLSVAVWLLKGLVITRLKASVGHEFNVELERLRASIREKQDQIDAVRKFSASAMLSSSQAVDQRRIEAVDAITASVEASKKYLWSSSVMSRLVVEEVVKELGKPNVRQFIDGLAPGLENVNFDQGVMSEAAKAQPYVTISAWALYKSYVGILSYDAVRLLTLKQGFDPQKFTSDEALRKSVLQALPHYENYLDKYGATAYHFLLEDIETVLMKELRAIVDGRPGDALTIERAQGLLNAVNALESSNVVQTA